MEWKAIETAPEKGDFLVFIPNERDGKKIQLANFHPNLKIIGNHFAFDMKLPTHWMPLPKAPE